MASDHVMYSEPMGRIILVRHGPTQFNVAALLRDFDDWAALTSPLHRARSTAQIIYSHADLSLQVDPRFTEVSFGCWEGLTMREINSRWAGTSQSSRLSWADFCPDGERYEDAIDRTDEWLQDLGDRNALIVTHGVIGSLIRGRYAQLSKAEMLRLPVAHDMIVILSDGREQQIRCR